MQFINKITGSIVEPKSEFAIKQMKTSNVYEEVKEKPKKEEPKKASK